MIEEKKRQFAEKWGLTREQLNDIEAISEIEYFDIVPSLNFYSFVKDIKTAMAEYTPDPQINDRDGYDYNKLEYNIPKIGNVVISPGFDIGIDKPESIKFPAFNYQTDPLAVLADEDFIDTYDNEELTDQFTKEQWDNLNEFNNDLTNLFWEQGFILSDGTVFHTEKDLYDLQDDCIKRISSEYFNNSKVREQLKSGELDGEEYLNDQENNNLDDTERTLLEFYDGFSVVNNKLTLVGENSFNNPVSINCEIG